jgi:hypothetical protein
MKRLALTFVLALCIGLTSFAQTTPPTPAGLLSGPFPKGERAPVANFTGVVYVATLVKNDDTFNCASSNVTFTPGARSHWHTHAA